MLAEQVLLVNVPILFGHASGMIADFVHGKFIPWQTILDYPEISFPRSFDLV